MANDKKSILKEALIDMKEIQEAADANAKKKLAEEFPKEFNNLLKEEINKNKKSAKESYKKLDEGKESEKSDKSEANKESDMKNRKEETEKVAEDVKITDTKGKNDPFTDKVKGKKKDVIEEERDKDFTGDVENDTPNQGKGDLEKGKVFDEKIKGPSSGKPISNLTEEFDISELDMSSVGSALENADGDDEVLTMEAIEEEIASMEGLGEDLKGINSDSPSYMAKGNKGIAFDQLVKMREQLDEMISGLGMSEQKNHGGKGANKVNPGGPTTAMIDEDEDMITDQDVEDVLGSEEPVDETMSISYSAGTITPGKLGDHEGTHGRFRHQQNESQKKIDALIKENKILTKKVNETKKYKESVGTLLENYKTALDKYRNHLKEMAVYNTNLAHVNNLLVNEELALTQDDKIKIINEFKQVNSIVDSQKKYKAVLTEMKESRKTLTENFEEKVSVSIQPSSKQKLDEVTAYKDDAHINKMKKLIETIEKRDKKIIR